MGQMGQALKYLVRRHAELIITGNGADGYARAFDDGHAIQNPRAGGDMRIFNAVCFHTLNVVVFLEVSKPGTGMRTGF